MPVEEQLRLGQTGQIVPIERADPPRAVGDNQEGLVIAGLHRRLDLAQEDMVQKKPPVLDSVAKGLQKKLPGRYGSRVVVEQKIGLRV